MASNALYKVSKGIHSGWSCRVFSRTNSQIRTISFIQAWLNRVSNKVDNDRLKLVGPDRACAEWLLRNGATVRFRGHSVFVTDYNALIGLEGLPESDRFRVEEIYAEDAGLSEVGFDHLKNCNHISKITLIKCNYLNSSALYSLSEISETLKYLEIRSCYSVADKGIMSLACLSNLNTLILKNLPSVRNKSECELVLRKALIKCEIDFQP